MTDIDKISSWLMRLEGLERAAIAGSWNTSPEVAGEHGEFGDMWLTGMLPKEKKANAAFIAASRSAMPLAVWTQ